LVEGRVKRREMNLPEERKREPRERSVAVTKLTAPQGRVSLSHSAALLVWSMGTVQSTK
jgi:hypothetical protein